MPIMFNLSPEDVVYTCLPLFHSAGGGLGAGWMWAGGRTLVMRRRFSASSFFQDCANHNVTVVQCSLALPLFGLASASSS